LPSQPTTAPEQQGAKTPGCIDRRLIFSAKLRLRQVELVMALPNWIFLHSAVLFCTALASQIDFSSRSQPTTAPEQPGAKTPGCIDRRLIFGAKLRLRPVGLVMALPNRVFLHSAEPFSTALASQIDFAVP